MFRELLSAYRKIQYSIFSRYQNGMMNAGQTCQLDLPSDDESHGDVVHPCVRYYDEGFEGHKWWMVYTPYYQGNPAIENPILCYAENNGTEPPLKWKFYCLVNEKPTDGYNSDPTLLFYNHQLYVAWRENIETHTEKYDYVRATFIGQVNDGVVRKYEKPLLWTTDDEIDAETCPTLMPYPDGWQICYGMHLKFHSKLVKRLRQPWLPIIKKMLLVSDLLGFYSEQKHYGIAIWRGSYDLSKPFKYEKTVRFKNCNRLYRPWHMDFFDYEGRRFAVVQTNQCNADIALAWSEDNEHFEFYRKPLITNKSINKLGIYKPSAGVTSSGLFFLYYTAQDKDNRSLNKLYLTVMPFTELLKNVE